MTAAENSRMIAADTPYSLTIRAASAHFGFSEQAFYDMIHKGKLHRGIHYRKIGTRTLIIRDKFIEWMEQEDGSLCA